MQFIHRLNVQFAKIFLTDELSEDAHEKFSFNNQLVIFSQILEIVIKRIIIINFNNSLTWDIIFCPVLSCFKTKIKLKLLYKFLELYFR